MNSETGHSPFDTLADRYDAWFDQEGKQIFEIEVEAINTILHRLPKPWLEVGIGSGRFAKALGIKIGIDPSTELVRKARDRGVDVHSGIAEKMAFSDASFGTVFLIVTICFLNSPVDAFQEIHRILFSDGKLVIGLVTRESPWGQFYKVKKEEEHPFYRFARFFSYDEIKKMLSDSGFAIEKTVSTLFQRPGNIAHIEEPRDGYWANAGFTIILARKNDTD